MTDEQLISCKKNWFSNKLITNIMWLLWVLQYWKYNCGLKTTKLFYVGSMTNKNIVLNQLRVCLLGTIWYIYI